MFGFYRTWLALAVMAHHLVGVPLIGHYAVHGFFILSGYLMTYVVINTYGGSAKGFLSFCINRAMRIYPAYWVILTCSVVLVVCLGGDYCSSYRASFYLPDTISVWLGNISLVYPSFFPGEITPRLSPPTWALTVELFYYVAIALGVTGSWTRTKVLLVLSVMYFASTYVLDLDYVWRYNNIAAGSLAFALGGVIYYKKEDFIAFLCKFKGFSPLFLLFLFTLNPIIAVCIDRFLGVDVDSFSFYLNYLLNFLIISSLINQKIPLLSRKVDKFIGDFSYPIYLMHWQVGALVSYILYDEAVRGFTPAGLMSFTLSVILCAIFSWFVIRFVDEPIERIRAIVRNKVKPG